MARLCAQILRETVAVVCAEVVRAPRRDRAWSVLADDDLWSELAACVLGSRVSHEITCAAVDALRNSGLLPAPLHCTRKDYNRYERACTVALLRPLPPPNGRNATVRYPFPALRASHLRRSVETVSRVYGGISDMLHTFSSARHARASMVSSLPGLGPKQTSLFLRNIGYTEDLAVLDVHVLRYMSWIGLATGAHSSPQRLSEYEDIEGMFREHARCMGCSLGDLDRAVWVVSRVAAKEMRA